MHPLILVPYDFSPAAERALCWAAELNRSLGGGALKLIHVLVLPAMAPPGELPLPPPNKQDIAYVEADLHEVAQRFAPGAAVEGLVAGNAAQGVLRAAETWSADLIVMGTHGRGSFKRLVLGSVADYVIRHAECPVVTLRQLTS